MTENVQPEAEGARDSLFRSIWVVLCCLVVLTGLLYGPTIARAAFVGDDWLHIERVPRERIPLLFSGDWHLGYRHVGGFYRPLPRVAMQFGRLCFDLWAPGYALLSALLHVVNCMLVWLVAMRLTNRPTVAWPSALIFAAYPTHPEAVLQASTVADPMATCGCLMALAGYLAARRSHAVRDWSLTWAGVVLAAVSKESWAALPLALILLEWVWPGKSRRYVPGRKAWNRIALLVAFTLAYVAFRQSILGGIGGYGLGLSAATVRQTYDATFRLVLLPFAEIKQTDLINVVSLLGGMAILWTLVNFSRVLLFAAGWMVLMTLPLLTLGPRLHDGGRLVYVVVVGWALFVGGLFDALVRAGQTTRARQATGLIAGLALAAPLVLAQQYNCADWRRSFAVNRRLMAELHETAERHAGAPRFAVLDWPERFDAAQSNRPMTVAKALEILMEIDADRVEAGLGPDAPPDTITFAIDKSLRLRTGRVEGVERWIWSGVRLEEWRPEGNARLAHARSDGSRDYVFGDRDALLAGPPLEGGTGYYGVLLHYEPVRRNWGFVMWRRKDDISFEPSRLAVLRMQPRLGDDAKMANPGWLTTLRDVLFLPSIDGGTITVRSIEIARFDIVPP